MVYGYRTLSCHKSMLMIKIYKKHILLTGIVIAGIASLNYSSGPANTGSLSVTGAPFGTFGSGTYCSNCHGGGSYAATASIQLLSNGNPVTGNYVPGWSYTLRITRTANAAHASIANAGFGFQITCVNSTSNANINTWGTPPANTANRTLSSRNYIEHTSKLSKSVFSVDIPWTGPPQGTGTVKFYLALNTVNGDGGTSSDQPVITNATFTQAPLPVSWLYFKGKENDGKVLLEWATANEADNKNFTIERSSDGRSYESIGEVDAMHNSAFENDYTYTDPHPLANAYYRIRQTDFSGNTSYYNTIRISADIHNTISHYIEGDRIVVMAKGNDIQQLDMAVYDMNGRRITREQFTATEGSNVFTLRKPQIPGMYVMVITGGGRALYFNKLLVD